jgi:UDP-N-acetylmuramoyl-L-alanyl-D-glutamate--2,6-diaminopimelate ligase
MRLDGLVAEASLQDLGLLVALSGDAGVDIRTITLDSREVEPGAMFACVPGETTDGHLFAPAAVAGGASALLCERTLDLAVPQVLVSSVRRALGPACDVLYGRPSANLTVAGVTGTNGKTTTCAFMHAIFEANGWPCLTIGTLSQRRTTPEAPELQRLLAEWRQAGGAAVSMEVSSHALQQHRADAVRFAAGVFTNLTRDHLDYHETMDAYFDAKAMLFEPGRVAIAVINRSDPWGRKLIERIQADVPSTPVVTFEPEAVDDVVLRPQGSSFTWDGQAISLNVGGRFNLSNAVAAATCARALGVEPETIAAGLARVETVDGRFELVDEGQPFTVVVDYAHTPDGLAKVLQAARELSNGRLILVFGAGGERDHDKRPLMGAIASEQADLAVVTSDNPRSEEPDRIIEDILRGTAERPNVIVDPDRASAIATALANAEPGDMVVVAGKGHEQGEDIGGRVVPFDDVDAVRAALVRIRASRQAPQ